MSEKKKQPILSNNPLEAVLNAQGMTPPQPKQPEEPQNVKVAPLPELIPAPTARKVDYITVFGDYAVPTMRKVPKSRRVQLQLYPETYQKAADIAADLDLSFNDIIAAAIEKMYKDYSSQEKG